MLFCKVLLLLSSVISAIYCMAIEKRNRDRVAFLNRDVYVCTSKNGLKSCGWHSDCSTVQATNLDTNKIWYQNKVCCNYSVKCCTDDGHFCRYADMYRDIAFLYWGSQELKFQYSGSLDVYKEAEVGFKGVKSTGYKYGWKIDYVTRDPN